MITIKYAPQTPEVLSNKLPTAPTLVSSFLGSLIHRNLGCICNGRRSQRRALKPDSLLLAVWCWACLELLDTQSCSRLLGKTTARPPNTPAYHCHLRGRNPRGRGSERGGKQSQCRKIHLQTKLGSAFLISASYYSCVHLCVLPVVENCFHAYFIEMVGWPA